MCQSKANASFIINRDKDMKKYVEFYLEGLKDFDINIQ